MGDKIGYIKAVIDFALLRADVGGEISQYLLEKVAELKEHSA